LFCEGDDLVERVVRQQNAGVFGIASEPNKKIKKLMSDATVLEHINSMNNSESN
jgi:hypothetical protein